MSDDALRGRVERLVGPTVSWRPAEGGYTQAARFLVDLADGRRLFVKAGTDPLTSGWLRDELRVYSALALDLLPDVVAVDDAEPPVLVLEAFDDAHWPPPWRDGDVGRVLEALERLHAVPAPPSLPGLESLREELHSWPRVAADPAPFLSLEVADRGWLERCLRTLTDASAGARLGGNALVHVDVRSDNLCFAGARMVLVDWNQASRGDPAVDAAFWAPSLHAEGGPPPEEVSPGTTELAALIAGYFAARAGLPPPGPGSRVREIQRTQLVTALRWACRALDLPPPIPSGRRR